jgi:hypothetical protein
MNRIFKNIVPKKRIFKNKKAKANYDGWGIFTQA